MIPTTGSMMVTDPLVTLLVLQRTTLYLIWVPPTKLAGSELPRDLVRLKEEILITAVLGAPAPRLLVTLAMLVMGPVGQAQLMLEVTVQVTGVAQAEAKLPTFQVKLLPEKLPQALERPVKQEGKLSVTVTLFSAARA